MRRSNYNKHQKNKNKKYREGKRRYKFDRNDIIKKIKVRIIDDPIQKSIDEYNKNHFGFLCTNYDDALIVRVTLNHLRHHFTNYDEILKTLNHADYDFNGLKELVNKKIMKKYRHYFEDINEWALKDIMKGCIG